MINEKKLEAQLTKYFHKVICNTASNYYKKCLYNKENEYLTEQNIEIMGEQVSFEEESIEKIMIEDSSISVFQNEIIGELLPQLSKKENQFLIEKFILYKTDKEIGEIFGTSRQAVTNMKKRLYKKIREEFNTKKFGS